MPGTYIISYLTTHLEMPDYPHPHPAVTWVVTAACRALWYWYVVLPL